MVFGNVIGDVLWAIIQFFLNPLFATALIVAVFLGYFRVKKERRSFRVRLLPGLTELKRLLSESWLYALVLSILISGIGLMVDPGWLVLFCIVSFVGILSFYYKIVSPIYFATVAFFGLYFLERYAGDFVYRGWTPTGINVLGELSVTVAIIAGLLLVVEGRLISRFGARDTSPRLVNTNRGLRAAVFKSKRLWLLPVLFLVPGELISAYIPYWPQFTLGERSFSFIPIPLLIGFSQVARSAYPEDLFPEIGRNVVYTGFLVIVVGICSIWLPISGAVALLLGVICRIALSIVVSIRERSAAFVVGPRSTGVVIAGVIPDSPGEKMGLLVGECIRSVNGREISNEKELYDAIQLNAAHCRLQVIGRDGEVRLMQQVVYRHDHHRLGLLVVQ